MKILIIALGYPTEKYKGHGIFEFDQAKALAKLGHEVIFASVDMRSIRRWRRWDIEKLEKDGVLVYGINYPLGRVPGKMLTYFTVQGLKKLYKKIERESGRPDIMHAHFTGMGYAGAKLKEITGIPLVITEHSSQINKKEIDMDLYQSAKKAYKDADSLIAVSPALANMIKYHFGCDATYIPNMVDTNAFTFEYKKTNDLFTFISVGNLIETKRMDLTIEAFYREFKDAKNTKLIIVGEGPEKSKIESLINKYDLKQRIKLTGSLERKDISKYMNESDCFVLPSRAETFGVVYIEAMSVGLPVIATKCGGPEDFVNNSNGLLIDVDDLEQLRKAIRYMYDNIGRYDKKSISDGTLRNFSPENVASLIVNEYNKVLERYRHNN